MLLDVGRRETKRRVAISCCCNAARADCADGRSFRLNPGASTRE